MSEPLLNYSSCLASLLWYFFFLYKEILFFFTNDSLLTNPPGLLLIFVIFFRCLQIINLAILRTEIKDQLSSFFCLLKSRYCLHTFFSPLTPYLIYQVPKGNCCWIWGCWASSLSTLGCGPGDWKTSALSSLVWSLSIWGWDLAVTGFRCKQVASTAVFSSGDRCKKCCLLARSSNVMEK